MFTSSSNVVAFPGTATTGTHFSGNAFSAHVTEMVQSFERLSAEGATLTSHTGRMAEEAERAAAAIHEVTKSLRSVDLVGILRRAQFGRASA